jgi:hypothetical protein
MKIKIPYTGGPDSEALADCIDYAAQRAKITDERGLRFLTFFFERLVDNVCAGRVVGIPAVGKFGPWLEERQLRLKRYNHGLPFNVPKFVPAPSFRRQCKDTAPTSRVGKRLLNNHRLSYDKVKCVNSAAPTHVTMARIRASIDNQLGQ